MEPLPFAIHGISTGSHSLNFIVGNFDSLLTIYQMGIQETVDLIFIGFCKPQFYKRSVWNKALRILEFLCDNTDGAVFRHDFGNGKQKYDSIVPRTMEQVTKWAYLYKNNAPATIKKVSNI